MMANRSFDIRQATGNLDMFSNLPSSIPPAPVPNVSFTAATLQMRHYDNNYNSDNPSPESRRLSTEAGIAAETPTPAATAPIVDLNRDLNINFNNYANNHLESDHVPENHDDDNNDNDDDNDDNGSNDSSNDDSNDDNNSNNNVSNNINNYDDTISNENSNPNRTENEYLDSFALKLTNLARLLDSRAKTLQAAETRLVHERKAVHDHQTALTSVESRARQYISDLLRDITTRRSVLLRQESRLQRTRHLLETHLSDARDILADAALLERDLPARRAEAQRLRHEVAEHEAAVADARASLADACRRREHALADTRSLLEDRRTLQRATERIERMDQSLRDRETNLQERERQVTQNLSRLEHLQTLERIIRPLQTLLDELCVSSEDGASDSNAVAPDVKENIPFAVDFTITKLADMRKAARDFERQSASLDARTANVEERARANAVDTERIRKQLSNIAVEERRLQATKQVLDRQRAQIQSREYAVEEARKDIETREEQLRTREDDLLSSADDVSRREAAIAAVEQTLARKERSVARALAAVEAREQAFERRTLELNKERSLVEAQRKDLELREGLLHTRDLELSARITKQFNLDQYHDHHQSRPRLREHHSASPNYAGLDHGSNDVVLQTQLQQSQHRQSVVATDETGLHEHAHPSAGAATATTSQQHQHRESEHGGHDDDNNDHDAAAAAATTAQTSAETPERQSGPHPATVRRHLAFESSMRTRTGRPSVTSQPPPPPPPTTVNTPADYPPTAPVTAAAAVNTNTNNNVATAEDNESETAAEQLLPELMSARAVWRERITRVEQVVQNMQEQSRVTRPHVQAVLEATGRTLRALRVEVESNPSAAQFASLDGSLVPPSSNGGESRRTAYAQERDTQVRWSALLKEQLDVVREVQTGMLIGLHPSQQGQTMPSNQPLQQDSSSNSATSTSGQSKDSSLQNSQRRREQQERNERSKRPGLGPAVRPSESHDVGVSDDEFSEHGSLSLTGGESVTDEMRRMTMADMAPGLESEHSTDHSRSTTASRGGSRSGSVNRRNTSLNNHSAEWRGVEFDASSHGTSVDATVDATETLQDDSGNTAADIGPMTRTFNRFRQQVRLGTDANFIQDERDVRPRPNVRFSAMLATTTPSQAMQRPRRNTEEETTAVMTSRMSLLGELTGLRNELQGITGLSGADVHVEDDMFDYRVQS